MAVSIALAKARKHGFKPADTTLPAQAKKVTPAFQNNVEGWIINRRYIPRTNELVFALETETGKTMVKVPPLTPPYCFVRDKDVDIATTVLASLDQVPSVNNPQVITPLCETDYTQVFSQYPPTIADMRDVLVQRGYEKPYAADVLYVKVNQVEGGWGSYIRVEGNTIIPMSRSYFPRVLLWDTESFETKGSFREGKAPIACIGTMKYDTGEKKFFVGTDERELLLRFLDYAKHFSIWVEYSGSGVEKEMYDAPTLQARCDEKKIKFDWFSVLMVDWSVFYSSGLGITGYRKPRWTSLDYVGKKEVGVGKIERTERIDELFERYMSGKDNKLEEYCMRDVEIIYLLEKKLGLVRILVGRMNITGTSIKDSVWVKPIIEMMCMKKARRRNPRLILPCSGQIPKEEKLIGAMVYPTEVGLHKTVVMVDEVSVYNRITQAFNISPETYDPINGDIVTPYGKWRSEPKGIIPELMEELEKLRNKEKLLRDAFHEGTNEWTTYEYGQRSTKTILLSFPGLMGSERFMLFHPPSAQAVNLLARDFLAAGRSETDAIKATPAMGDTDSLALKFGDVEPKVALDRSFNWCERMSDVYTRELKRMGVSEEHLGAIEIKPEMLYQSLILYDAKKRRIGKRLWTDGDGWLKKPDIHVMGLEIIRSEREGVLVNLQSNVCEMMLDFVPQSKIEEHIENVKKGVLNFTLPPEEFVISKGFSKYPEEFEKTAPPQSRIAGKLRDMGYDLHTGDKVRYYYSGAHPLIAVPYFEGDEISLSYEARKYYWYMLVEPNISKLTDVVFAKKASLGSWVKQR